MHPSPVAIVTGSSRGIGRAIAVELARTGHAVVVNYLSQAAAADEVAAEITAAGGTAICVRASVAEAAGRAELVGRAMNEFGRLDVLVNNAGITSPGRKDLLEATEESWNAVFDTNLKGPFFLAQLAARSMVELTQGGLIERGTIVNVSSISAYAASTNRADYCLAKSAFPMLTWLFAERLAPHNILCYEVCPGVIESDMTAPVRDKYERLISGGLSPLRRWGRPEDVALAVSALVSGAFPFSTGDRINVDGGFHIRRL